MQIINKALEKHRAVNMAFILLIIAGIYSYFALPKENSPDVQIPIIYVSMYHQGISPNDAERLLVRPIEAQLKGLEGVKDIASVAQTGYASVRLNFDAGFDAEKALQDVREKVDIAKAELPEDAKEPKVSELNFSQYPVLNVILQSDIPERILLKIADDLKQKIEATPNVLKVNISGDREEEVHLTIPPDVLKSYNLSTDIIASIRQNNILVAAGATEEAISKFNIKLPGLLEDVFDIMNLPVKASDGAVVRMSDIVEIRSDYKQISSIARANGTGAIVLEVSKRTGRNIIETIDAVKQVISTEQAKWGEYVQVIYSQDESKQIRQMLADLQNNVLFAILLVVGVMMWFIGVKSALFISISIPGAFFIGLLTLHMLGLTMNLVVLFALILAIGMLVDSSIVVIEYANRKMGEGKLPRAAFSEASARMAVPIIASTLTTLVVFAPLLFWPGVMGQFMKYLPLTLIATLSGSLLMALIFIPVLGSLLRGSDKFSPDAKKVIEASENGKLDDIFQLKGYTGKYARLLDIILKMPGKFALCMVASLFVVMILFKISSKGTEFFPKIEPKNIQVIVKARGNLSVYEKDDILKEVEGKILDMQDEVKVFYSRIGSFAEGNRYTEDTIGVITAEFVDFDKRRKAKDIMSDIRQRLASIYGIEFEVQKQQEGPPQGKPFKLQVSSAFPEKIYPAVELILEKLANTAGIKDIETNLPIPAIEWEYIVDRAEAAKYRTNIGTIGQYLRMATNGMVATKYRPEGTDEEVDVTILFPERHRNLESLNNVEVITPVGSVPVANFITRTAKPETGTIHRADGFRTITIQADVEYGIVANTKVKQLESWLKQQYEDGAIAPEVMLEFKGEQEDQKETFMFLIKAFLLAIFMMGLLLVWQFNSFFYTFIIMSAIFLSTAGVLLGLLITNQPFGVVMVGVGIISLAGVVVNNNIIFIDTYKTLRQHGTPTREAIIRTGTQRLRPILLTAFTTVLGLIPMVFKLTINIPLAEIKFGAPSTDWWVQLSTAIAGGLSFATMLTLFFTPSLLMWKDGKKKHKKIQKCS